MATTLTGSALPSHEDAELAKAASEALARAGGRSWRVQVAAGGREVTTVDLPPIVVRLLMDILEETAAGHALTLVPYQEEITTQQAADLLNVSQPYLIAMIDKGQLSARTVGNQRRLPLKDLLAYRDENQAKRLDTLRQLTELDQELGLE